MRRTVLGGWPEPPAWCHTAAGWGGAAPQLQVAGIIWTSGRTDQHARVVNRLGEAKLEHLRLQATLHQVGGLERKHVLKVGLGLVENAEAQQPAAGSRSNDSAQVHVAPPKSE